MNEPFITVDKLIFRHRYADKDALRGISFQLEQGRIYSLLGVNGSGKSTLLALLAGVYAPTGGTLSCGGSALYGKKSPLTGKCALAPQDPDLYILGSLVEEDLLLALDPENSKQREHALALAREFGLYELLNEPVQTLSYGQKRKLCLASSLAARPILLLLDEPFAGLDHPSALSMREAISRNREEGLTQVITGHDLDLVADLADEFILLENGFLVAQGNADAVFPLLLEHGVRPPCWWLAGGEGPLFLENSHL